MENTLYYGDNLPVLRKHIPDNSIDLIYLDPPFNSKATYNILFQEPNGLPSKAQITAFEDTWHWTEETETTFQEIVETASAGIIEMMRAFRTFIGHNDMMAYLTMMCIRLIELKRVLKDTGSIYLHCDPTASHYLKILMDTIFGKKNFRNEIVWHYQTGGASKKHYAKKHDILLFYTKSDDYYFNPWAVPDKRTEKALRRAKNPRGARISLDNIYKIPMDVWSIQALNPMEKERLGYPTQKPEALLEKIIKVSSNEGDIVLDPFCGCGTAIAVAERLNHKWIGIDITHLAINLIKWRMKNQFGLEAGRDYGIIGEPEDLNGAKQLAKENRYQFQWWALSLINARPYGGERRGADTGIDGYLYFADEKNKIKRAIVQVKSGTTSVRDIRDLGHVIDREKSEIGIFITLEKPTRNMIEEAASKGLYKSKLPSGERFPRIQILTIKELLEGIKPKVPITIMPHKVAPRYLKINEEQFELLDDEIIEDNGEE